MDRKAVCIWVGVSLVLAFFAYFFALDSIHIPNIGDESVYIQIARKTAESGHWLPLLSEEGIKNTKPPLLFWQGMITTCMGKHWSLWNLRIPVVLTTLLVAFFIGLMLWQMTGGIIKAFSGGLIYLGFMSTIQQGRPFLMHAAETLFLFLPFFISIRAKKWDALKMILSGCFLGFAALYKSFFLIIAGGFALALVFARESRWKTKIFFRNYGVYLSGTLILALGIFSLWLLLDPRPDMIVRDFFLGESAAKFTPEEFFTGLFSGPYTVFRIWLGNLANSGLYVFLLVGLAVDLLKRRRTISLDERRLWLYILAFLIIYSFPTQRQENYILPTCAALSVLIALRWDELPDWAFRASHVLMFLTAGTALWFLYGIENRIGKAVFSPFDFVLPAAVALLALAGVFWRRPGRFLFPGLVLAMLLAFGLFLEPFSHSFSDEAKRKLTGKTVFFPSHFFASHEIYRFVLPGADIRGYDASFPRSKDAAQYLAYLLAIEDEIPSGYRMIDQIYHLRSRHSRGEMKDILFRGKFELLVGRLALVEKIDPVKQTARR